MIARDPVALRPCPSPTTRQILNGLAVDSCAKGAPRKEAVHMTHHDHIKEALEHISKAQISLSNAYKAVGLVKDGHLARNAISVAQERLTSVQNRFV